MYSIKIKPKVEIMFEDLRKKVNATVSETSSSNDIITNVTKIVSSELATRSKSILSDMLFELSDTLMDTDFFTDITKQNNFLEINLRQEILSKYRFSSTTNIDYNEASKTLNALKVGVPTFVVGGIVEVGVILIAGLSLSSLVPIPISLLIVASIGSALATYYNTKQKNKNMLRQSLNEYLLESKQQFLNWFDEVEKYYDKRVEEIIKTL